MNDLEIIMPERLTATTASKLKILYPDAEFLKREFLKMEMWLEVNSRKTPKSKSGWSRFILGWLERGWEPHRKSLSSTRVGTKTRIEDIL